MDPELRKVLNKQTALLEENNALVKKVRRSQLSGTIFWILKWIIILGAAFGFYYRFQPAILHLFELYDKLLVDVKGVSEFISNVKAQQQP